MQLCNYATLTGILTSPSKWVLVGVIGSSELGTPEKLKKLEKKDEHGETVPTYVMFCFSKFLLLPFVPLSFSLFKRDFDSY